ncbi:superfamily II DNA/RNA helicase [Paenibacillus shirakamiensis]|uniref:Superfamily II DNA/RNA helicase n=1 Tax=Paenibacillus shirakamiensis TaxID=1265935 RepID=A0ABS4JLY1_9BACL|nr:DEAD/DEAH box helicase [Paenibacillus shirakamiensis]MBP2002111.1 superfamily II DNA/RNA helicase [Paenibacillus shirakamiensis]
MTVHTFNSLGVTDALVTRLAEFGIQEPSPVQAETISAVLDGKDVLAESQTGTGKTLAYLLPILQRIQPEQRASQVLILAPTQELAMQILRESQRYGESLNIEAQALIGGAAVGRQIEKLRSHPQLLVGTPGRVKELIKARKIKMHTVRTIVVDEVDQVFQLGGSRDVEDIIKSALRDRQLLFLSATINRDIADLAFREMKEPVEVGIEPEQRTSKTLEHLYFVMEEREKPEYLRRIVRTYNAQKAIVFVNQTDDIGEVEAKLNYVGIKAQALYGDADKTVRSLVLRRFREGSIQVLVASDVAARGLDIEDLGLIISYDPATDSDHYVHRSGRTGRMGRQGISISLVTSRQEFIIRKFSRELDVEFVQRALFGGRIVDPAEAERSKTSASRTQVSSSHRSNSTTRSDAQPDDRKSDRHRDRKNKGAPKWSKDNQPRS